MFTADHGDLLGDFGTCFKANHLNGAVRVPFVVAGPGIAQGETSKALVGLQDILPTFASMAHTEVGQEVQGKDLSSAFGNTSLSVRDYYYSSTGRGGFGQSVMLTDGKWKYIYSEANGTEELYDQDNDPGELHNLAHDSTQQGRMAAMRHRLREIAADLHDDDILDGDGFAYRSTDRSKFAEAPASAMGWRWY